MRGKIEKKNNVFDHVMKLKNVSKTYKQKSRIVKVLTEVNIDFDSNNFYAIMGHSGSGKSTLINILGLIDTFDSGTYELYGTKATSFNDKEASNLRMKNIGFIFQGFHLNPNLKAFENVIVPMIINKGINPKDRKKLAIELLESVGLGERVDHFPNELSGGEQQRVAIARALANNPHVILADEPSGNLDEKSEEEIFRSLKELSQKGKCIIVVSHSNEVKKYADKVLKLENGKVIGDSQ
ncbi:MAG: ABC transporter ATP-binding protein [Bacilli bacterium]|nr:ABC transporter ATP-binding protein [Bacilli bacterium]